MFISVDNSMLLIIDIQTRLAPAIPDAHKVVSNTARLLRATSQLNVPQVITEHYSKGLGPTVPGLVKFAGAATVFEKIYFSALRESQIEAGISNLKRPNIIVTGTETHVCVMQTVLDLVKKGYQPFIATDATASRNHNDHETAIMRMRDQGVGVVTTEMVLFEWLEQGATEMFRNLLPIIKQQP
jgi:nicotinamidase-related amidase